MRRTTIVPVLLTCVVVAGAVVVGTSGFLPEWLVGSDVVDADGARGMVEGWVGKVDAEDRIVHVTRGLLPLSVTRVTIDAETDIRIHDKIGSIDDLRGGVRVKVCYDVSGDGRSARRVEVPPSYGPCPVATARPAETLPSEEPLTAAATPAPGAPSPRAEAPRAGRATSRASAVAAPARTVLPGAAHRAEPASEREAVTSAAPPPARRDSNNDGHDYGAVVDWVLRR